MSLSENAFNVCTTADCRAQGELHCGVINSFMDCARQHLLNQFEL